jgi:hypothetical protein
MNRTWWFDTKLKVMSEISLNLTFSNELRNHNEFELWSPLPPFPDHLVTLTISIGLLMVVTIPNANINVFNVVIPLISNGTAFLYLSNLQSGSTQTCITSMPRAYSWWWTSWPFWYRRWIWWEPYWRMLKNMWYIHFFLFKKFSMPHFYLLPLLLAIMSSLGFTKMFEFLAFPSIIIYYQLCYYPFIYPLPILMKHHTWYLLDADLFYQHSWHSIRNPPRTSQRLITLPRSLTIRTRPLDWNYPISSYPIQWSKKKIFDQFLVLLYCGMTPLNHLSRNDWVDIKWLCIDWHLPHQTVIIIWRFCEIRIQLYSPQYRYFLESFTFNISITDNIKLGDIIEMLSMNQFLKT